MRNKQRAFTILELLVVVAIIAILAMIAIPNFIGRIEEAKASQELAEISAVEKAIATYYADNGIYPTLQGKDGSLVQPQPIDGSPHNIDFSSLVPNYLATLPHFSYWWVDYQGNVYHTEKPLGSLSGTTFTPTSGYSYTLYKTNGTTQVLSAPYTLQVGEYLVGKEENGTELPKLTSMFKNEKMHPQDPEYVAPVLFQSQTFEYTGSQNTFTVPVSGTYKLEVWGAQGTHWNGTVGGGKGGYAYGNINLSVGNTLTIFVGGSAGYNQASAGGGSAGDNGSGGGGTDIRLTGVDLSDRVIAGGGGGGGMSALLGSRYNGAGGAGGGLTGIAGQSASCNGYTAAGGAGASIGGNQGGKGVFVSPPLNGFAIGGGGGGSSYLGTLTSSGTAPGVQLGNGKAIITYVGP